MFVGHYGVSFAAKAARRDIPLWVLFVAVQFLDIVWAVLVLFDIEKLRIVPGITATNPLDLYYMPYTHGLITSAAWSLLAAAVYHAWRRNDGWRSASVVGIAVFSHWALDLLVHRPDLPLYADRYKVGFGLWNYRVPALSVEVLFLLGGMSLYLRGTKPATGGRRFAIFGVAMLAVHGLVFYGPALSSGHAAAVSALIAYGVFAAIAWWLETRISATKSNRRIQAGTVIEPRDLVTIRSECIRIPDSRSLVHLQFRRFAGCPICKLHLRSIARRHDELVRVGIVEVAVFHSSREAMLEHQAELPFAAIADPAKELYAEFGVEGSVRSILDPRAWGSIINGLVAFGPGPPAKGESGLGLPADFLLAPSGEVVAVKYGVHADDHWEVDEILALAQCARPAGASSDAKLSGRHQRSGSFEDTHEYVWRK